MYKYLFLFHFAIFLNELNMNFFHKKKSDNILLYYYHYLFRFMVIFCIISILIFPNSYLFLLKNNHFYKLQFFLAEMNSIKFNFLLLLVSYMFYISLYYIYINNKLLFINIISLMSISIILITNIHLHKCILLK